MNAEETMAKYNSLVAQLLEEKLAGQLHREIAVATIDEMMGLLKSLVNPDAPQELVDRMIAGTRAKLEEEFLS